MEAKKEPEGKADKKKRKIEVRVHQKNEDRDCCTEKAEENQGLEKYRENQSSEGNQIGIFFYLWFYVEISFSRGQQIL